MVFDFKKEYKELSVELAKAALEGFNITYRDLNEQQQHEIDKRFELEAELSQIEADLILIDQNHESQIDFEQTLLQYFNQKPANKWHYSLDALDEDSNDEFVLEKTVEVRNYAIPKQFMTRLY